MWSVSVPFIAQRSANGLLCLEGGIYGPIRSWCSQVGNVEEAPLLCWDDRPHAFGSEDEGARVEGAIEVDTLVSASIVIDAHVARGPVVVQHALLRLAPSLCDVGGKRDPERGFPGTRVRSIVGTRDGSEYQQKE